MYLWSIYIAKVKTIACVLIGIVDVAVAMESASIFKCAFISKSLYYILSPWCPFTCSIIKFDGKSWRIMESASA